MRDRKYAGSEVSLKEKKNKNIWDSIDQFIEVLNKMRAGEWNWYLNTKCKYVDLRVDMRDGGCLIMDKDGNRIDPKDLAWQYKGEDRASELNTTSAMPGAGTSPAPQTAPGGLASATKEGKSLLGDVRRYSFRQVCGDCPNCRMKDENGNEWNYEPVKWLLESDVLDRLNLARAATKEGEAVVSNIDIRCVSGFSLSECTYMEMRETGFGCRLNERCEHQLPKLDRLNRGDR